MSKKEIMNVRYIKSTDYKQDGECFIEYEKINIERIKRQALDDFCSFMNEHIHEDYITFGDLCEFYKVKI